MPSLPPAIDLNVLRRGRGPLVVGLHDLGSSGMAMQTLLRPLRGRRIVTPDLRGHGGSPTPAGPWNVDDFSSDVARVIAEEGDPAIVVGAGLGAAVAISLALGHPGAIAGMVLSGFGARPDDARRRERWDVLAAGLRERYGAEGIALGAEAMAARPDWRGILDRIEAPTAVLIGSDDDSGAVAGQRELALRLPHAEAIEISGAERDPGQSDPERLFAAVRSIGAEAITARAA